MVEATVTEATTQTLLGTLDNGRKLVMCATTETGETGGSDTANATLTITVGKLTRIDGFLIVLEDDGTATGVGDLAYAASGNVITVTAATGIAHDEACKFRAFVIGT